MKGLSPCVSVKDKVLRILGLTSIVRGGKILEYQRYMRLLNYNTHKQNKNIVNTLLRKWYRIRFNKLGEQLGFSIGPNVFGYGLLIPHCGTIVINSDCNCGNYCVLHTSICIAGGGKSFGDGLYLSAGAKVTGYGEYGEAVSIAANSVANLPSTGHTLLVGMPAVVKKYNYPFWYERDGEQYLYRVKQVELLKNKMNV